MIILAGLKETFIYGQEIKGESKVRPLSLKDLGKKWFAFSIKDVGVGGMLRKLDGMG